MSTPASGRAIGSTPARLAGALLHPCHVLRIAGEPVTDLAAIATGEADAAWARATALRADIAAAAPAICAALEAVVPTLDQATMRAALAIKRAVFRHKPLNPAWLADLGGALGADTAALTALADQLAAAAGLDADLTAAHGREMAHGSRTIDTLLDARNMTSGLSYTNPDFLHKLTRHFASGRGGAADAKTVRNIEDSLLQYHARSSTKTSPLSSFTVIHVGDWHSRGDDAPWAADFVPGLRRRVELKAGLMRHLLAPLLGDFAVVAAAFPLRRNPSVTRRDGRIRVDGIAPGLEATGRTWGTGLTVAQLDDSAILACLDDVLAGTTALAAADIVAAVRARAPKLPPAALTAFIGRLFAMGFLVADTGFVEQGDALGWARGIVANPAVPRRDELAAVLDRIDAALAVMAGDESVARAAAVKAINADVHALADLTGADHGSPHFKPAFYENCYLPATGPGLDPAYLARFEPELAVLHDLAFLLDPNQELHGRMADFFVARFGADGVCADVAGFIEAFDDIYAPGVLDAVTDAARAAPTSAATAAWLRAAAAFDRLVDPFLAGTADIDLDLDAVRGVIGLLPPSARARSASYSYVVQTARAAGADRLVLNQVFGGRSSILSRFLEDVGEARLEPVRAYLAAGAPSGRSAEIGGVFGFNANRHPALAATELEVPPFPRAFAGAATIALPALTLAYDAASHRLVFRGPDGVAIDVWYHGLLIPSLLPRLHRVLALAFTEGPSLAITKALSLRAMGAGRATSYVPRIALGGIVLSRRTWLIAAGGLPDPALATADFYIAVRGWQATHGLPDRIFIRALPLPASAGGEIEWAKVNFKDMKPFYVDLRSPRFVRLLQNMVKRSPAMATCVSELLPDFDQHPTTIAGTAHVSELHFELTRPAAVPVAHRAWFTVRVAYFATDRRALIDGPVAAAVDIARRHGADRVFVAPHWKFGPHVDLNIHADAEAFAVTLFPAIEALLAAWLADHPSTTVLDPADYARRSRDIGVFELDRGPYLPLLRDNSVTQVPYAPSATLVHPALAASREAVLSDSLDLVLALYRLKATDPDAVFLALHAMLAVVAGTWVDGMAKGVMSLRSHADYFFAAHDTAGGLRAHFDAIDAKRRNDIDAVTAAIGADMAPATLGPDLAALVTAWRGIVADADARNRALVATHLAELVGQSVHMDLAVAMAGEAPSPVRDAVVGRRNSDLGEQFLNTAEGLAVQRSPAFIAYRTNVNFFYALLPILEIAPMQKFLLCHLTANSVSRVFPRAVALIAAE